MYRVITYKSKELKKKTIDLAAAQSAADFDILPEEKKPKRRRKKQDESLTFIIDGVEVREEDLTPDERADIEAETLLNEDGFYTALKPIDVIDEPEEEEEVEPEKKAGKKWQIAAVVTAAVVIIGAIGFFMIRFL